MQSADSSNIKIGIVSEVTEGTTPGTPTFTPIRITGESLSINQTNEESEEIRADGNVADIVTVAGNTGGSFNFEMIYGNLDTLLESLFRSAFSTDVLVNGVTDSSVSLQKYVKVDGTTNDLYALMAGVAVDSITIEMNAQQRITGSCTVRGMSGANSGTITGSWGADNTNAVMDMSNDFTLDALHSLGTLPIITALSLTMSANTREKPQAGSKYSAGTGRGQFTVSGRLSAYLQNRDLIDQFDNEAGDSLEFTLGSVTLKKYSFNLPKVKFTNVEPFGSANNQDVLFQADFKAYYDSGIGGTCELTRAVA